jgi:hypothetical protein
VHNKSSGHVVADKAEGEGIMEATGVKQEDCLNF